MSNHNGIRLPEGLEAVSGLMFGRQVKPKIQAALDTIMTRFMSNQPERAKTLLTAWKRDREFRGSLDKKLVGMTAAIETLSNQASVVFGPFRQVYKEVSEYTIRDLPDMITAILDAGVVKLNIAAEAAIPPREDADQAFGALLSEIQSTLPSLLRFTNKLDPSKFFTRTGEQVEKALVAAGPEYIWAMSQYWMTGLSDDLRERYGYVLWGFDTVDEIEHFCLLPSDLDRQRWLEMLYFLRKRRLPFTTEDLDEIFEKIRHLHVTQIGPKMVELKNALDAHRRSHVANRTGVFATPAPTRGFVASLPTWAQPTWVRLLVIGALFLLIIGGNVLANVFDHNRPDPDASGQVKEVTTNAR